MGLALEGGVPGAHVPAALGLRLSGGAVLVGRLPYAALATSGAWTDAAGLGLEAGRVYLEDAHGVGDASRWRLAVGVRL